MSADAQPIDPARFAMALEGLPLDALHSKAAELRNSISHLKSSNSQMLPFADQGDADCREAIFENLGVIGRMNQRLELLRQEVVEKRGMPWVGDEEVGNGQHPVANDYRSSTGAQSQRPHGGRVTDEDLRRQVEARMNVNGDVDGDEEGVHL